jgi:hypothetical protein
MDFIGGVGNVDVTLRFASTATSSDRYNDAPVQLPLADAVPLPLAAAQFCVVLRRIPRVTVQTESAWADIDVLAVPCLLPVTSCAAGRRCR